MPLPPPVESIRTAWRQSSLLRGGVLWVLLVLTVAIVNWRHRELPYYWDALGYVYSHCEEIHRHHLNPILTEWDVGHPTGFFLLVAAAMKIFGVGPFAGHLVVWGFTALLLLSVYGLSRALNLPRKIAVAVAGSFLLFPLVWSMTQQILLDLPLLAATLAAYWFWVCDRKLGYALMGGFATLIKLHGFLLIAGPLAAVLFSHGRWWRPERRRAFLVNLGIALTPLLTIFAFLIVRFLVRGPGATVDWTSGNQLVPLWDWGAFRNYLPYAYDTLFRVARTDWILFGFLAIGSVALLAKELRKIRGLPPVRNSPTRSQQRLIVALVVLAVVNTVVFLQLQSLCPRYAFPILASLYILGSAILWHLLRRPSLVLAFFSLLCLLFMVLWHPRYVERLPSPLSGWLRPEPIVYSWGFENDLRFHDAIRQIQWGYRKAQSEANARNESLRLASHWPSSLAYMFPQMGYVDTVYDTRPMETWEGLDAPDSRYVILVRPLTSLTGPPPSDRFSWENIAIHQHGDLTVEVWRVQNREGRNPGKTNNEEGRN